MSQAVVVVRRNQLICAFYTGKEVDAKELRNIIGKKLPRYMLPHIFTRLDAIPLISNGKINCKALTEINLHNISNIAEYAKPEGELEKQLASVMEETLHFSPVGRNDDFFDLGGDSLKAIEYVSKAHNRGIYFNLQNLIVCYGKRA